MPSGCLPLAAPAAPAAPACRQARSWASSWAPTTRQNAWCRITPSTRLGMRDASPAVPPACMCSASFLVQRLVFGFWRGKSGRLSDPTSAPCRRSLRSLGERRTRASPGGGCVAVVPGASREGGLGSCVFCSLPPRFLSSAFCLVSSAFLSPFCALWPFCAFCLLSPALIAGTCTPPVSPPPSSCRSYPTFNVKRKHKRIVFPGATKSRMKGAACNWLKCLGKGGKGRGKRRETHQFWDPFLTYRQLFAALPAPCGVVRSTWRGRGAGPLDAD